MDDYVNKYQDKKLDSFPLILERKWNMTRKFFVSLLMFIIITAVMIAPVIPPVYAQNQTFEPGELPSAAESGLRDDNLFDFIASAIRAVLGVLGAVLLVIIIYGGFLYATAAGNEERVTQAKNTLVYAIIGIVIISAAWIFSDFIISNILLSPA